ncbi:MAG: protein translocase subunit SecF [Candidatus Pacebacteria bacterium]|nr:protein translocase subunit SecF [Candidatus Paceibacterota bacterium]
MIKFTKYYLVFLLISIILIIGSFFCIYNYGLKLGIDFTGGSIIELEYENQIPLHSEIKEVLGNLEQVSIQSIGEKGILLRTIAISENTHQEILNNLREMDYVFLEQRFESIGPIIGQELREKTIRVVFWALLLMILYISFAFRKVRKPLNSWQYGLISVFALFHDIIIPLGILAYLRIEMSIPIITALLAVVGYSINNTVVVFDRIRENLVNPEFGFNEIIDRSLNQTLSRQINTSLTTLFVVAGIFFFGGETLKYFALALMIGIIAGTYSSIFLVSSLLTQNIDNKLKK